MVIANIHETYNILDKIVENTNISTKTIQEVWKKIIVLLMPLIPHLAHECWIVSTKKNDINDLFWPKYNPKFLKDEECSIVIQVEGRKRGI